MKSIFDSKKNWVLLLLITVALTTGVTFAKYTQTFKNVGSFSVSIKGESTEVFAVYTNANSLEFFEDSTENVDSLKKDIDSSGTATYEYTDEANASQTITVSAVYEGVENANYSRGWTSQRNNITSVVFHTKVQPRTTSYWFSEFEKCTSFKNLDKLDTSKAVTMANMFWKCYGLNDNDLKKLIIDTASAASLKGMFRACDKGNLKNTDGNTFNFKNSAVEANVNAEIFLTDVSDMFRGCGYISKLDLSNLYIASEDVNFSYMFFYCERMTSLTLPQRSVYSFAPVANNEKGIYGTANMFHNCFNLQTVDISFIKTRSNSAVDMFTNCYEVTTIWVDKAFAISSENGAGTSTSVSMFVNCFALVGGNGTTYEATKLLESDLNPNLGANDTPWGNSAHARIDGHEGMGGYLTAKDHSQVQHADVSVTIKDGAGFTWDYATAGQHAFFANSKSIVRNVLQLQGTMPEALKVTVNNKEIIVYDGQANSFGVKYDKANKTLTVPANLMEMYVSDGVKKQNTIHIEAATGEQRLDFAVENNDTNPLNLIFGDSTEQQISFTTNKAATVTASVSPANLAVVTINSIDEMVHTATVTAGNSAIGSGKITFSAVTANGETETRTVTINVSAGDITLSGQTFNVYSGGAANITGGRVDTLTVASGGTVTITGGTVNKLTLAEEATVTITGGTFGFDPTNYVPREEGYTVTKNEDETWTVAVPQLTEPEGEGEGEGEGGTEGTEGIEEGGENSGTEGGTDDTGNGTEGDTEGGEQSDQPADDGQQSTEPTEPAEDAADSGEGETTPPEQQEDTGDGEDNEGGTLSLLPESPTE